MKKTITMIILSSLVLLSTTQLFAGSNKYAIGMNLVELFQQFDFPDEYESEMYDYIKFPVLYGTVLTNKYRIEPEFSFWRYSQKEDYTSEAYSNDRSTSILHLGIGFSRILKKNEKSNTYLGLKMGINRMASTTKFNGSGSNSKTESKRTDFYLGPAFGVEYFITDQLSLGSELQFQVTFLGEEKYERNDQQSDNRPKESGSLLKSKALLFLRLYL